MDILLLIVGLGLILAGANFLTDGSAALAQCFRVPEFIIGLTVVAVGTSTPELVVSVLSAIGGQSDVAIGNVVGSNIFNVFVILGVCALIRPVPLTAGNIRRDIPFGVLVSLLLLALAQDSLLCKGAADRIGRLDGAAMLALYILLMWYTIRKTKRPEATAPTEGSKAPMAPCPSGGCGQRPRPFRTADTCLDEIPPRIRKGNKRLPVGGFCVGKPYQGVSPWRRGRHLSTAPRP